MKPRNKQALKRRAHNHYKRRDAQGFLASSRSFEFGYKACMADLKAELRRAQQQRPIGHSSDFTDSQTVRKFLEPIRE